MTIITIAAVIALSTIGELRVLVLSMIAEEPRHGYELIKSIEDRMGGSYSPARA